MEMHFKSHNEEGIPRTNVYEEGLEDIFIEILHDLAKDLTPLFKKQAEQKVINSDIRLLDSEIAELLSTPQSASEHKEQINELIVKRAYMQYERAYIDDFEYQTGKIKRMITDKDLMDKTFDAVFFRGVIEKMTVKEGGILVFHFLNGYKVYRQYNHKEALRNVKKKC